MRYTLPSLHCGPSYPREHKHLSCPTHFPFTHDLHSAVEDNGYNKKQNIATSITILVYEQMGSTIKKLYFINLKIRAAITVFCPVEGIERSCKHNADVSFYKVDDCVANSCLLVDFHIQSIQSNIHIQNSYLTFAFFSTHDDNKDASLCSTLSL